MTTTLDQTGAETRLQRMLGYVEADPGNLRLIADAAAEALSAHDLDAAEALFERYGAIEPLSAGMLNMKGLVAIGQQRFEGATAIFGDLLADYPSDPAIRFNLAWCASMQSHFERAADLIDEAVVDAAPRAASLKVQALHHLGRLDEALAVGAALAERRAEDTELMGALAVVALDAQQAELAGSYAARAGDTQDGLSTAGMLLLAQERIPDALVRFDRALAADPESPRNLLGKGLGLLAGGDRDQAPACLDRAAEVFGDHLGSWIAAGWAYFVKGDLATSRARFEHALALDDSFAETHGGLAVLDIVEGDFASARRRTEIALRLDRDCLSAILAKSLLAAHDGDPAAAARIQATALNLPIGPGGKTLAAAMAGLGTGWKGGGRK